MLPRGTMAIDPRASFLFGVWLYGCQFPGRHLMTALCVAYNREWLVRNRLLSDFLPHSLTHYPHPVFVGMIPFGEGLWVVLSLDKKEVEARSLISPSSSEVSFCRL